MLPSGSVQSVAAVRRVVKALRGAAIAIGLMAPAVFETVVRAATGAAAPTLPTAPQRTIAAPIANAIRGILAVMYASLLCVDACLRAEKI